MAIRHLGPSLHKNTDIWYDTDRRADFSSSYSDHLVRVVISSMYAYILTIVVKPL